jgi:signal transduction histidine kinase
MKPLASLRNRIILVIMVACLPLVLLAVTGYSQDRAQAIAAVENDIRIVLRATLHQEAQVVASVHQVLRTMTIADNMQRLDSADCNGLAARMTNVLPYFANLGAALPDGAFFCSAKPQSRPINIADRRYFREVLATRQPAAGEYVLGRVSGEHSIAYALPMLDGRGEVRAVMIAATKLDWFEQMLAAVRLPAGWHALVVDTEGFVVARFPAGLDAAPITAAERHGLPGKASREATIHEVAVAGEFHLHGVVPLASVRDQLYLIVGSELATVLDPIEARFRKELAFLLALALASALLAWIAVRGSVIDGVAQLQDAVERFGLGELDRRAGHISSVSELQLLARRFDQMAERIANINRELETRVAQRTAALENANAELEAFAYSISHDLRAPLRAISGFAGILAQRDRAGFDRESRRHLDNIVRAADQMNRLIDDLLQYSRLGRGAVKLESVDLAALLGEITPLFQPRLPKDGRIEIVAPLANPRGDVRLIGQILANLLDNALKYQPAGQAPVIEIRSTAQDGAVLISVSDNGIGIAPEHHEMVFNVFQRLHGEDEYPGSGIGLAIARKAARHMNGTLSVESAPGRGSRFVLRLPGPAAPAMGE